MSGAAPGDSAPAPPGRRGGRARAALVGLGGALVAFGLMADRGRTGAPGVWAGLAALAIAAAGLQGAFGAFDEPDELVAARAELRALARPLAALGLLAAAFVLALAGAAAGLVPNAVAALLLPALATGALAAAGRVGRAFAPAPGAPARPPPFYRRHGFWVLAAAIWLSLPSAGAHSLFDPWETHYGEVAREVVARDDWISFWWAQEGFFWSKPALIFWLQALSMVALGVDARPDKILAPNALGLLPWPEWALRAPVALLAAAAAYALYRGVRAAAGPLAGAFSALVLVTAPQWALLSRQTMTDLPFVACLSASAAFALRGAHAGEGELAPAREVATPFGPLRLGARHALAGALSLLALPQALYLLSRHVAIGPGAGAPLPLALTADRFFAGSAGNCGLPGNAPCREAAPAIAWLAPGLQGALWLLLAAALAREAARERRVRALCFLAAAGCAALATLAKGPAGLALPLACVAGYAAATGRLRALAGAGPRALALAFGAVALPWFLAAYARHGAPFVDRLFFHDMWKRALVHVHDTNEGEDVSFRYYVWQLGYALFPWTAIAPAALFGAARASGPGGRGARALALAWLAGAFALFTAMLTKYHHYIFPAVPAAAALLGPALARAWTAGGAGAGAPRGRYERASFGAWALGGAAIAALVGRDLAARPSAADVPGPARLLHLITYDYDRPWPAGVGGGAALAAFAALAAAGCLVAAAGRRRAGLALVGASAVGCSAWTLDVYAPRAAPHFGQRETVAAYYRTRRGPGEPLVAYQMNWKGENFYTGNRLPVFTSGGPPLGAWLRAARGAGLRTFFFTTAHGRVDELRRELDDPPRFEVLTGRRENDRFALVRVVFDG
ncbi:MAG TPA: glycosyltransferase family 39 protein [Polyangiaceae bacterium]|nr:glycosyltransferase family 39 protein [Polyangiaceae bacterium]